MNSVQIMRITWYNATIAILDYVKKQTKGYFYNSLKYSYNFKYV